jgi:uncharacterized membrane protein
MFRLLTAFVVAPFAVAFVHGLTQGTGEGIESLAAGALVQAAIVLIVAVPIGLALFALAWKLKRLQWYWAAAAGAILGLLFFGPVFFPTVFDESLRDWKKVEALINLGGSVVYTTVVALATWALGIWRNPALWARQNGGSRAAV